MSSEENTRNTRKSGVDKANLKGKLMSRVRRIPAYVILGAWSLFTVFVILWIIMTSLKTNQELYASVWALPSVPRFDNYVKAWQTVKMGQYFLNSVLVVGISVLATVLVSAPASYVLSRVKFRGSELLTTIFTAGIGIPIPLLFIPLFVILSAIKLLDTLPGLILVYISTSIPFTVYLLTGFFASLPPELEDAAIIDGCTDFEVFWRVMFPLASPGLLTAAIFNFILLWNEYQLALVFISKPENRTLSLGLYSLQNAMQFTSDWVGLMAGVTIVMLPTIVLYIFLSEKMISGITMGAVK